MHSLEVFVKKDFRLFMTFLLKIQRILLYVFNWRCFNQCLTYFSFFGYHPLCTLSDVISSNIYEVPSINSSGNAFVFGDLNIHHKD